MDHIRQSVQAKREVTKSQRKKQYQKMLFTEHYQETQRNIELESSSAVCASGACGWL